MCMFYIIFFCLISLLNEHIDKYLYTYESFIIIVFNYYQNKQ